MQIHFPFIFMNFHSFSKMKKIQIAKIKFELGRKWPFIEEKCLNKKEAREIKKIKKRKQAWRI